MKDAIKDYLLNIGDTYIKSFVDYLSDKIKDEFIDLVDKIDIKEIIKKVKELKGKLIVNLNKKFKDSYKDDFMFKDINLKDPKPMINEILEKAEIYAKINEQINSDFKKFKIENNSNTVNILLMGEEVKYIDMFKDIIFKIFDTNNRDLINIKFNEYFTSIEKFNIIEYKEDSIINNINCIWYIMDQEKNDIKLKDMCKNVPIIYIGFKGKVNENTKIVEKLDENTENDFKVFDNFLIKYFNIYEEIEKNKKIIYEYFMRLIEKTLLYIMYNRFKNNIENKANDIISDNVLKRIEFAFGNKISDFYIFNKQTIQIIFKKFLNLKKLPKYVLTQSKELLLDCKNNLEEEKDLYFEEFFSKNIKELQKGKNKSKDRNEIIEYKILENMKNFMDERKKKRKSSKEVPLDEIMISFNDYFLKRSSVFFNKLIANTIKDMEINFYNNIISKYYIEKYKEEEIIIFKVK